MTKKNARQQFQSVEKRKGMTRTGGETERLLVMLRKKDEEENEIAKRCS